jgi:hypothetical protein
MHEPQEPTRKPGPSWGTDSAYAEEHPAFGMISASRTSGGESVLFDSDIQHQHKVRISVHSATRHRDLNRDWIHADMTPLVEVEMSEAQWASFVSSMNTSGVPCTLRRVGEQWDIPGLPYDPRLGHSMEEVRGAAKKVFDRATKAMAAYDALPKDATPKTKREAVDKIRSALMHVEANMDFAAKSLNEHAENVVQRARADIEAMVTNKAVQLGLTTAEAAGLMALPMMPTTKAIAGGLEACSVCGSDEDPCDCEKGS